MRKTGYLLSLGLILLSILGCSLMKKVGVSSAPPIPKNAMPDTVGKFRLETGRPYTEKVTTASLTYKKTDSSYQPTEITYRLETSSNENEIKKKIEQANSCSQRPTHLSFAVLKDEAVKDKSGKEVGKIKICRATVKNEYNYSLGMNSYSIVLSKENLLSVFESKIDTKSVAPKSGKELFIDITDFLTNIPYYSDLDFSGLNFAQLISSQNMKFQTAKEIKEFSPSVKITSQPYLKGKTVVVDQYDKIETEDYISDSTKRAASPEEIKSIIQISCNNGRSIGTYNTSDGMIPAYSTVCNVRVIDTTIPAVISEKTFTSTELPQTIQVYKGQTEYTSVPPTEKMRSFVKTLRFEN